MPAFWSHGEPQFFSCSGQQFADILPLAAGPPHHGELHPGLHHHLLRPAGLRGPAPLRLTHQPGHRVHTVRTQKKMLTDVFVTLFKTQDTADVFCNFLYLILNWFLPPSYWRNWAFQQKLSGNCTSIKNKINFKNYLLGLTGVPTYFKLHSWKKCLLVQIFYTEMVIDFWLCNWIYIGQACIVFHVQK